MTRSAGELCWALLGYAGVGCGSEEVHSSTTVQKAREESTSCSHLLSLTVVEQARLRQIAGALKRVRGSFTRHSAQNQPVERLACLACLARFITREALAARGPFCAWGCARYIN